MSHSDFFSESLGIKLDYDGKTRSIKASVKISEEGLTQPGGATETKPDSTVPATGGVPATGTGAGAGVTTPKKPSETIVNETNNSLQTLRASCQNRLVAAYLDYLDASEGTKESAKQNVRNIVASCDSEFAIIVASFAQEMINNGYDPTAAVQAYNEAYAQEKETAMNAL